MKVLAFSIDPTMDAECRAKAAQLGELVVPDVDALPDDDSATLAEAVKNIVESEGVDLVLLGASKRGKDVGPRAAALLDWPYAGEVTSIEEGDGGWSVRRMVLSGNSEATYNVGKNAVLTATAGTFELEGEAPEGTKVSPGDISASPVKVVGHKGDEGGDFDLGSADVVIGVGRGFKAQDDIKLAEDLAACFKGGAVGCSRPVAADLKWLGEEHWIGLSGHEIKPKAYIACGVSGQIQHVAGIRGSRLIVAINTNKDAPIFQVADFGIVGDLYDVVPKMTELLSKTATV